jgi:hypothetical protein
MVLACEMGTMTPMMMHSAKANYEDVASLRLLALCTYTVIVISRSRIRAGNQLKPGQTLPSPILILIPDLIHLRNSDCFVNTGPALEYLLIHQNPHSFIL